MNKEKATKMSALLLERGGAYSEGKGEGGKEAGVGGSHKPGLTPFLFLQTQYVSIMNSRRSFALEIGN